MTHRAITSAIIVVLGIISQNVAHAALVIADYNDLTLGGQQTQAGGTGLSGTWAGTGTIDVISGDLIAPASTNYALTQSGTPRSIIGDWDATRQNTRSVSPALTGNEVWYSFLVQNTAAASRGGVSFNQTSGTSLGNSRVQTAGTSLFFNNVTVPNVFTTGQTALVLGRIIVDDVLNAPDTWDIWVDPDLSNGPSGLGTPTLNQSVNFIGAAGITSIGNVSYHLNGTGGQGDQDGAIVDMIHLSDGPQGFGDVTGVFTIPEPRTLFLASMGAIGLGFFCRRRRRPSSYSKSRRDSIGRVLEDAAMTTPKLTTIRTALFVSVSALAIGQSQGAPLLEDGFATGGSDYSVGALAGQTGTPETGSYQGAWAGPSSGANFGEAQVTTSGLSYTDGGGNVLQVSGGGIRLARTAPNGPFQKDANVDPAGSPGNVENVYFSGILDLGGAPNGWFGIRAGPFDSKDIIGIGVNGSGNAEIRQNGSVSATSGGTFDVSNPLFLVGRIEANGAGGSDDLVYLYLNPLLPSEPGTADLTHDVGTRGWFSGQNLEVLELSANMATGVAATFFDEFRIGTSWADVTPFTAPAVPEPSALFLASLGTIGLGFFCRRRRRWNTSGRN